MGKSLGLSICNSDQYTFHILYISYQPEPVKSKDKIASTPLFGAFMGILDTFPRLIWCPLSGNAVSLRIVNLSTTSVDATTGSAATTVFPIGMSARPISGRRMGTALRIASCAIRPSGCINASTLRTHPASVRCGVGDVVIGEVVGGYPVLVWLAIIIFRPRIPNIKFIYLESHFFSSVVGAGTSTIWLVSTSARIPFRAASFSLSHDAGTSCLLSLSYIFSYSAGFSRSCLCS